MGVSIRKPIPSFDEVMSEDPKKPAIPSFNEVMGEKKKQSSGIVSSPTLSPSKSPFGEGTVGNKEDQERLDRYNRIMGVKDVEDDDPIATATHELRKQSADLYSNAVKGIEKSRSESTAQSSLSKSNKIEAQQHKRAADINAIGQLAKITKEVEDKAIPDADIATQALSALSQKKGLAMSVNDDGVVNVTPEFRASLPKNNQTVNALLRKVDDYNQVKDDFEKAGGRPENAAIIAAAKENPHFAEQLDKLQEQYGPQFEQAIPEQMRGSIISKYLNNPNVQLAASKDPYSLAEYNNLKDNLISILPEYGATLVGNELSKLREKEGKNNWLGNRPETKYMDDLAERAYANDPQKLAAYQNIIRKDMSKYIDAPGILEHVAGGAKHTVMGQLNSLGQFLGLKSVGENIHDELENQYGAVSADGKGLHSITPIVGDMGGMIATMAVTGNLLRGSGLINNPTQANTINTVATFYGDEKRRADALYPNDPNKSLLRAGAMTAAFSQAHNLFPTAKVQQVMKGFEPEADKIINELTEGIISKEAAIDATKNAFEKALIPVGKVLAQSGKATAENVAITLVGAAMDKVLNLDQRTFNEIHDDNELIQAAKVGAVGSIAPSMLSVYGNKTSVKNSIYEMASHPEKFKSVLEMQSFLDPNVQKSLKDSQTLIDDLSSTKQVLTENKVPEKLQKSYLLHTVNEKMLTAKAEQITDPTLKKKYTDQIKDSQAAKERILKGEDADHLPQEINNDNLADHEKMLKELFDGDEGVSFLDAADQKLLGGKKFDKAKVPGFLEEVAMQANNLVNDKGEIMPAPSFDSRKSAEERWGEAIIKAANDMYPEYKKMGDDQGEFKGATKGGEGERNAVQQFADKIKEGVKMDSADELQFYENNKKEIEAELAKGLNTEPTSQEKPKVRITADELEAAQPKKETTEVFNPDAAKEPPTSEPIEASKETSGSEEMRLAHADTKKIYEEANLPERLETPNKSDKETFANADKLVKDGYDFDKESDKLMSGEKKSLADDEQVAFAKVVAAMKEKQNGLDVLSPEFAALQDKIEKYSRASDVSGTQLGRDFRARKTFVGADASLADYIMEEKTNSNTELLTDAQKQQVQKEYGEIKSAEQSWKDKFAQLEEKHNKMLAEREVGKTSAKTKSAKKDYKKEREEIFTSIKEKLRKSRGELNSAPIPYAKELFTIAPDVAKLVKNLVEEGVTKLADIVKSVHGTLKDDIPQLQEKDVIDLIAGKYNEKKATKKDLAIAMENLRIEAKLIDKLDALESGQEPASENKKQERNKEITELRSKIKNIEDRKRKAESDAKKEVEDAKKEEDRLDKEFEKEKDAEAKAILKEKAKAARELSASLDKKTAEETSLQKIKSRMNREIKRLDEAIKNGDYGPDVKKEPVPLDAEGLAMKDKLIKLRADRKVRQLKQFYQNQSRYEKGVRMFADALNVPRALMSTLDLSAVLRQAVVPTTSNLFSTSSGKRRSVFDLSRKDGEVKFNGAVADMFKGAFSKKHYDRWFNDLQETPRYEAMKEANLALTDSTSLDVIAREEDFMSNLANKIPIIGETLRINSKDKIGFDIKVPGLEALQKSERAYSMYLNKMRVDLFNRFADSMEERGLTIGNSPKEYKQMAAYVNNATGRGDLGGFLNKAAPFLNALFFSPRLIASRMNMMTYLAQPRFWKTVPKEVRIAYFKDMAKFIGVGITVLALAKLNGAEVEDDPRSSDYGKIKMGNTRWDIWGGFQQYAKVGTQIVTGERVSSTTGKVQELNGEGAFGDDRGDVLGSMMRGKLAPVPSMAWDLIKGRNIVGEKIELGQWESGQEDNGKPTVGAGQYLLNHFVPLTFGGLKEAVQDRGVKAFFDVGIPSVFGVGTQVYSKPEPSSNKKKSTKHKTKKSTKD